MVQLQRQQTHQKLLTPERYETQIFPSQRIKCLYTRCWIFDFSD